MGALSYMPNLDEAFARLTERQRAAELEAFWTAEVAFARDALRNERRYSDAELRNFCAVLRSRWGDATDYLRAGQVLDAIDLRERQRAHEDARRAVETPAQVFARHAHRWPAILGFGAVWAAIMLSLSGWVV